VTEPTRCRAVKREPTLLDVRGDRAAPSTWDYRCSVNARPDSPFCGTHAWLTDAGVTSIEWGAMTDEEAALLITQAEATNRRRDQDEREMGFLATSDDTLEGICRTAILAIGCGLQMPGLDVECFAEAMAMLGTAIGYRPWEAKR
jgi:hypothetical protein